MSAVNVIGIVRPPGRPNGRHVDRSEKALMAKSSSMHRAALAIETCPHLRGYQSREEYSRWRAVEAVVNLIRARRLDQPQRNLTIQNSVVHCPRVAADTVMVSPP